MRRQPALNHNLRSLMGCDQTLWGLLYESKATEPISQSDLETLLRKARARNASMRITGWLTYSGGGGGEPGTFNQYLEGPRNAVRRLFYGEGSHQYEKGPGIVNDPRHTDVRVVQEGAFPYGPPGCRLHPAWFMNLVTEPQPRTAMAVSE
jgi:hypothetical protein